MFDLAEKSLSRLKIWCEQEEFKGWDPFDGLNSIFFQSLPFASNSKLARLAWLQLFKRLPWNLRTVTGVKKEYNSKGLGLFLAGYCNLYKITPEQEYLDKIKFLSEKIIALQNKEYHGACWGYNFDWQARAFFQPKNTPTVVATVFIASALLDAYEITGEGKLLDTAKDACQFILKDLNRTYDANGDFCFSYSPLDHSVVFNASLLGSRLLARVYSFTKDKILIEEAKRSVIFCCSFQQENGSWSYGTLPFHQWIDGFHTGYNLECINDYMQFSGDKTFTHSVQKGLNYYLKTFFTETGIPKYYSDSIYPIDIHSSAQFVVTMVKLNLFHKEKELIDSVLKWTVENMQSKSGYFYYQFNKYFSSKIPYMRWAQAWMFYALSNYIKADLHDKN